MNGRQLTSVAVGLLVFAAGAVLALRPVELPRDGAVSVTLPLVDPLAVLTSRPGPLLLALAITLLGVAVAVGGCYLTRTRR